MSILLQSVTAIAGSLAGSGGGALAGSLARSGAPAGFAPTDVAGCVAWYDASNSANYDIATGISDFYDGSAQSNDLSQATGSQQPTISSAWQNGLDGVRHTAASSQFLALTSGFTGIASGSYAHLFAVADLPAIDQVLFTLENAGGVMSFLANGSDPQARFNTVGDSNERASWGGGVGSAVRIWEILVNSADTVGEVLADDVSRGTGDPGSPATGGFAAAGDSLHIGSWSFGGAFYNGTWGEIIVYSNASVGGIATADRTDVMDYLSTKWGVTI